MTWYTCTLSNKIVFDETQDGRFRVWKRKFGYRLCDNKNGTVLDFKRRSAVNRFVEAIHASVAQSMRS